MELSESLLRHDRSQLLPVSPGAGPKVTKLELELVKQAPLPPIQEMEVPYMVSEKKNPTGLHFLFIPDRRHRYDALACFGILHTHSGLPLGSQPRV